MKIETLTGWGRLGVIALVGISGACVGSIEGCATRVDYVSDSDVPAGAVVVQQPPPPPPSEVIYPAPSPDCEWVRGVWIWDGYRYHWRRGYWEHRPFAHAHWHEGGWRRHDNGYVHVEGHWS